LVPLKTVITADTSVTRILVVDDHEPWRRFACTALAVEQRLRVIGQASDGFDGVRKAQELQPDLVLLDVGLPGINGLQVAIRIAVVSPSSKILFLSLDRNVDIVRAALRIGYGYVLKVDAGKELLPAVTAVLRGDSFVSRGIRETTALPSEHTVHLYSDDESMLEKLTTILVTSLRDGQSAVGFVIKSHRDDLRRRLQITGIDVDRTLRDRQLTILDAAECVSGLLDGPFADWRDFLSSVCPLIERAHLAARDNQQQVLVFGEMVALLWNEGRVEAAVQLERMCNSLARIYCLSLLCIFPASLLGAEGLETTVVNAMCEEHSTVTTN
jgi:two-component system, NarL family, nitrate/nitrite response regulator NarL